MVNKGGQTFWAPENQVASARRDQGVNISSINKWEQAFRIFSHIYIASHPSRATELTQYSFIIHDAAQAFPWENVYAYDRIFRRHMSKFPTRSWGIILQQAWSFKMRNRVSGSEGRPRDGRQSSGNNKSKEVCWKFNRGKCTI